jgi:hypothetical protein
MKRMAYRENYEMQLLTESGGGAGLNFSIKRNLKTGRSGYGSADVVPMSKNEPYYHSCSSVLFHLIELKWFLRYRLFFKFREGVCFMASTRRYMPWYVCVMAARWVRFAHRQSPISLIPEFNWISEKAIKRII